MSAVWVVEVGMDYEGSDVVGVFGDRLDTERAAKIRLYNRQTYGDDTYSTYADDFDPGDDYLDNVLDRPRERDATSYRWGSYWATCRRWKVE